MTLELSTKTYRFDENGLIWAILASILLHITVAVVVPNFEFTSEKEKPQVLKIELMQPTPPTPVVAPLPPVKMPEPPKPETKKEPKPIIKPKPVKKVIVPPAEPEVTPQPVVPEVIAVAPTIVPKPEIVVPPPKPIEPPPPPEPSQSDIDDAKSAYGNLLGRTIAKYKSYPKIAERRGWQGTALLDIKMDSDGNVLSVVVRESSGYDALDNRALEMVKKASPFPQPPKVLQGRTFNISVPVAFKLANG